ncbi:putative integral membrane protein [Cryptosporidium felis]|nr:putative integral membrane protein [Cryptosporidium felis]
MNANKDTAINLGMDKSKTSGGVQHRGMDSKLSIIPNTIAYKFMRGFICFMLVSLSMLYLIFSCSFAIKYKPLVFDNVLTETIKGTIKGANGEFIEWIATIPTGLVSRTVAIICVVMYLIFGVYTLLFSFYTACKKYKFIQPWYFLLLSAMSCVGGLISIFLSNKFEVVKTFTGREDCLLQSLVSNDCSIAIENNEIFAYDLCKAVESFCLDEHSYMSGYYVKSIVVAVISFIMAILSFVYGIILLRLNMRYSKRLAILNEKNRMASNMEMTTQQSCDNEGKGHAKDLAESKDSTRENTNVTNSAKTVICQNSLNNPSCKAIQPHQNDFKAIPMGIVLTTTTSKQCHISHPGAISQINHANINSNLVNPGIGHTNFIQHTCQNGVLPNNGRSAAGAINSQLHHHHHHHHHHHSNRQCFSHGQFRQLS